MSAPTPQGPCCSAQPAPLCNGHSLSRCQPQRLWSASPPLSPPLPLGPRKPPMPLNVALTHRTTYRYDRLVTLGPQTIRLRPAPHARTPDPVLFAEDRAAAAFPELAAGPAGQLPRPPRLPRAGHAFRRHGRSRRRHGDDQPVRLLPGPEAEALSVRLRPGAGAGTRAVPPDRAGRAALQRLLDGVPRGEQRTVDLLVALNRRVQSRVAYIVRMEPGVQTPEETLRPAQGLLPRLRLAAGAGCCAIWASPRASSPAT